MVAQRSIRVGILGYGLDRPATGIARYTRELLTALRAGHPEIDLVLLRPFPGDLGADLADIPVARLAGTRRLPAMMTAGPFEIATAARRLRLDVVHDPAGISPFVLPRRVAPFGRLVTLHDMIPFVHPETHARLTNILFRRYIPRTLPFVDRVVTVSNAAKADIERFYGLPSERITAIPHGVSPRFRPRAEEEIAPVLARYRIERPYILTVGAIQARKNLAVLFDAFADLRHAGLPHQLVVVGPAVWTADAVFQRLAERDLGDAVLLTGYVADDDLPALYAGAGCFVFPSLYEGFGLPPLEALASGTPVVASNTSSMPEVLADAALLLDPHDSHAFATAIRRVVEDGTLAARLREQGLARSATYRWRCAAARHAALYREVAARTRGAATRADDHGR